VCKHIRLIQGYVDTHFGCKKPGILGIVDTGNHTRHIELKSSERSHHQICVVGASYRSQHMGGGNVRLLQRQWRTAITYYDEVLGDFGAELLQRHGPLLNYSYLVSPVQ
jgi:hypothetical protein